MKRTIVVELKDITAIRFACQESNRGSVLLTLDGKGPVWPDCQHVHTKSEDPTLKLLVTLDGLIRKNASTVFSLALELNEA